MLIVFRLKYYIAGFERPPALGEIYYELNKFFLNYLIDFCLKHKIKPVLVTIPCTDMFADVLKKRLPHIWEARISLVAEIRKSRPDILFLDHITDENFIHDYSLFGDFHHLSQLGAEKFTGIILRELGEAGLL